MKLLIVIVAVLAAEVGCKILPDYIPQCKRHDPEFVKCVVSAVDKVRPYLVNGIPEINVPPYDPLRIPTLTINRNLEALRLKAKLERMKVWGPNDFKLKNIKIDLKKHSVELKILLPHLYIESHYDVAGRLLVIPLAGKGKMMGNFTDCTATAKGSAKVVTKDGVPFYDVDKFTTKIKIGGGKVNFIDADGSSALIAETAAAFFNSNPRLVLNIFNPIVEDTVNALFMAFADKIIGSIPISELLPED